MFFSKSVCLQESTIVMPDVEGADNTAQAEEKKKTLLRVTAVDYCECLRALAHHYRQCAGCRQHRIVLTKKLAGGTIRQTNNVCVHL